MVSIAALGHVPPGRMVHRSGAKPGDRVMVTGTFGDASLGLDILIGGAVGRALADDNAAREMLISRYRVPQPRSALALALRDHASAAMDVSDGLAGDFAKLCAASGVSAAVDVESVPLSAAGAFLIAGGVASIEALISAGDDYEIVCTIPQSRCEAFIEAAGQAGVVMTSIGTIVAGNEPPRFLDAQGSELALRRLSYSHF
jgi:thiamine-monophosphate kinase